MPETSMRSKRRGFTGARLQSLARLAAYVLIFEYLLNLLFSLLPISSEAERLFTQIGGALDTASLPLIAVTLMFAGFTGGGRAAGWEWALVRRFKLVLITAAVLYLLLIPAIWITGSRIQGNGDRQIKQQSAALISQLTRYRNQIGQAPDSTTLRQLIEAQPQLRQSLPTPESPFASQRSTLPLQQDQALRLVDRIKANIQSEALQRLSAASGELRKQELRYSGLALAHALFFALACLIWPQAADTRWGQDHADDHG